MMVKFDILALVILAACLFIVAGCKDRSEPLPIVASPPAVLRNWSAQEECALSRAFEGVPDGSILWLLHDDWARMRKDLGHKPGPKNTKCKETIEYRRLAYLQS